MKIGITEAIATAAIIAAATGAWMVHGLREELGTTRTAVSLCEARAVLAVAVNAKAKHAVVACETAAATCRADTPRLLREAVSEERESCADQVASAVARGRLAVDAADLRAVAAALRARRKR